MKRNNKILRVVRLLVIGAALVLVARYWRTNQKMSIPAVDQSMAPQFPGGSVVVFEPMDADDELARDSDVVYVMERDGVKYKRFGRVRALPGDEVGSKAGKITVNGTRVGPIAMRGPAAGVVPDAHVYILAINPAETRYPDSRQLGFIPRRDVIGVIRYRFGG